VVALFWLVGLGLAVMLGGGHSYVGQSVHLVLMPLAWSRRLIRLCQRRLWNALRWFGRRLLRRLSQW
jgi:hypothetical protein